MQLEDKSLWQSFLDGDRQSFQAIYVQYYGKLYEYGMRRVENADWVEDTIQDLFVRLWTNRRNLGPTDNIKFYLFTALKRRLMDAAAVRGKTLVPMEEADHFRMDFSTESDYFHRIWNEEQAKRLLTALDQLTGRQKEVIYLRYFEELSYEEIAEVMDISTKATYKLIYRALDALKEILDMPEKDILLLLLMLKIYV